MRDKSVGLFGKGSPIGLNRSASSAAVPLVFGTTLGATVPNEADVSRLLQRAGQNGTRSLPELEHLDFSAPRTCRHDTKRSVRVTAISSSVYSTVSTRLPSLCMPLPRHR